MKNQIQDDLLVILKRIIKKKNDLDKIPHEFGTGIPLFHAELQLLELINENKGKSVSDIAKINNVTKGAISQTLKKVVDKGFVNKQIDPKNITRNLLFLSKKGQSVLENHDNWHKKINIGFDEYVDNLIESEIETIKEFLTKFEFFVDKHTE